MSEQFDMEIYNIALRNGSYTESKTDVRPISNLVFVGDSAPNSNLTFLTESKKQGNVEYKQFSNNEGN